MTYTDYLEQQRRNEQKLEAAKARLGTKWILHPANKVRAKPVKSVLPPPGARA